MRNRADPLWGDFDSLVRAATAFGTAFVVASCAGERRETSASSTAAVTGYGDALPDGGVDPGCPDPSSYFIEVTGDAGTTMFRSSCANATGDFGAVGAVGGPFSPPHLGATLPAVLLEACSDRSTGAAKISILLEDGGPSSVYWKDTLGNVSLSFRQSWGRSALQIGPLGGVIEGTYATQLYAKPEGTGHTQGPVISGSFRVCHLQDVDLTPVR